MSFICTRIKKSFSYLCLNARVASGGYVPRGQGLQQQSHPKEEEHPQAYQPATQPRVPLPPPPTIAPVTLRPETQ